MNKIIPECLIDCSTDRELSFAFCCDLCGNRCFGARKSFSKAGILPESEGKLTVYRELYRREWERFRESTAKELAQHINRCPICGRYVCDDCFLVCDDLDMCRECAERLNEKGRKITEL